MFYLMPNDKCPSLGTVLFLIFLTMAVVVLAVCAIWIQCVSSSNRFQHDTVSSSISTGNDFYVSKRFINVCFGYIAFALMSMVIQEIDSVVSTATPHSNGYEFVCVTLLFIGCCFDLFIPF
jgi:TRAP-type mannitol/chloroaromatic compound transport system permease small subunit